MGKSKGLVPVVVTTSHRGVFFGYGKPTESSIIRIEKARMCVYWAQDMKGVLGLASAGPSKGCRVGPAVPAITLRDVTSIIEVSKGAAKLWETAPWS